MMTAEQLALLPNERLRLALVEGNANDILHTTERRRAQHTANRLRPSVVAHIGDEYVVISLGRGAR